MCEREWARQVIAGGDEDERGGGEKMGLTWQGFGLPLHSSTSTQPPSPASNPASHTAGWSPFPVTKHVAAKRKRKTVRDVMMRCFNAAEFLTAISSHELFFSDVVQPVKWIDLLSSESHAQQYERDFPRKMSHSVAR